MLRIYHRTSHNSSIIQNNSRHLAEEVRTNRSVSPAAAAWRGETFHRVLNCRGCRPIGGQYLSHVTCLDQSEAPTTSATNHSRAARDACG